MLKDKVVASAQAAGLTPVAEPHIDWTPVTEYEISPGLAPPTLKVGDWIAKAWVMVTPGPTRTQKSAPPSRS